MSMSTHVIGIKPPDTKWRKMKAIYDACVEAEIDPPDEVQKFFVWEKPDPKGVIADIKNHECCSLYKDNISEGFEIDLKKLPKDITIIRFYNSW